MTSVVPALLPVFALIMLGAVLRRLDFPDGSFWPPLERLTYFVLFPPLLFHAIVSADLGNAPFGRMALILAAMMTIMALAALALRRWFEMPGPAFTSFFQGTVRWNSFVALAAIGALYGRDGLAMAAVAVAVMVPVANVYSVLALVSFSGGAASPRILLEQIVRNPLIQACALGILVKAAGVPLPGAILSAADMLGKASLTLGLFAVGASLDLSVARMEARTVVLASALKLIATPIVAAIFCWCLGVDGVARGCAVICAAVPGAASAYILAKQLGGDAPLMAGITTAQTLAAMATMPLVLAALL